MKISTTGNSQKHLNWTLTSYDREMKQLSKLDELLVNIKKLNDNLETALRAQRFSPSVYLPQRASWFDRIKQIIGKF